MISRKGERITWNKAQVVKNRVVIRNQIRSQLIRYPFREREEAMIFSGTIRKVCAPTHSINNVSEHVREQACSRGGVRRGTSARKNPSLKHWLDAGFHDATKNGMARTTLLAHCRKLLVTDQ